MLGVDIGTSSSKGVVVSLAGTVLATATREHTVQRPAAGHVEMDSRVWWHEFTELSRELLGRRDTDRHQGRRGQRDGSVHVAHRRRW